MYLFWFDTLRLLLEENNEERFITRNRVLRVYSYRYIFTYNKKKLSVINMQNANKTYTY